jgi:ATP-dependent protease Clp ATPase subunit
MDLQGQLQAALEFQRSGKSKREVINTRHILFIVSGAFDGLDEIVRRRLKQTNLGFAAQPARQLSDSELFRQTATRDLIDFGFEPEFVGRLPVRVVCDPLSVDDLYHILKNSEGSVVRQYVKAFESFGIEIIFTDEGLRAIAERAAEERTGARGLMTVCERTLRDFKFELPSTLVKRFAVTRAVVENPHQQLQRILHEPLREDTAVSLQLVREFERQFAAAHGLKIHFTEEAAAALARRAAAHNKPVRQLCSELFKDYEFGLNLIKKNTGRHEFELPVQAVDAPDKFLSDWVVAAYRDNPRDK